MKPFNKKIQVGTKVKLSGIQELVCVKSFENDRKLIKVEKYMGSFQNSHVESYSNK
jgi:hypothetical protein